MHFVLNKETQMKKTISILLILSLLLLASSFSFAADSRVLSTVKALGIMVGDSNGNLNLSSGVTRAEFAKMLVMASPYSDECEDDAGSFSLFKDVDQKYWANQYIYVCASHSWLLGYTDGNFHPGDHLTLEQCCAALIRMLGYTPSELKGSYPNAYLNKAEALGLLENVSAKKGQKVSREDCANIFYNLMLAETGSGKPYGESLGCTVSSGQVNYTKAVESKADGTYIGIVNSSAKAANETSGVIETTLSVTCQDGVSRSFVLVTGTTYSSGSLVLVNMHSGDAQVSKLQTKSMSGRVSTDMSKFGSLYLSDNLAVLDVDGYGNACAVEASRLAGIYLKEASVKYYSVNAAGYIDVLVLADESGDLVQYGLCTSADKNENGMNLSASYTYLADGKTERLSSQNVVYPVEEGGIAVGKSPQGELKSMKQLKELSITVLNANEAVASGVKYPIDEAAAVYIRDSENYYNAELASVNTDDYNVTGYYDDLGYELGGRIRILVCVKK